MNTKQAMDLAKLQEPNPKTFKKPYMSAGKLVKLVFQAAADAGRPIEMRRRAWRKKWLASDSFLLTDIDVSRVAVPMHPDKQLVARNMQASAIPPIVVDWNKNEFARTPAGFIPKIVVVDGVEQHRAAALMGRGKIQAWIGDKALAYVRNAYQVVKPVLPSAPAAKVTKLEAAAELASGVSVPRQDRADEKMSVPHKPMPATVPDRGVLDAYGQPGRSGRKPGSGNQDTQDTFKAKKSLMEIHNVLSDAAHNNKMVTLSYQREESDKPRRYLVEPYSYRGDKFFGYDASAKGIKAFNLLRITNAAPSSQTFKPKWKVELAAAAIESLLLAGADLMRPQSATEKANNQGSRTAPSKGASNSELQSKIFGGAKKVDDLWQACQKDMKAGKFIFRKRMMGVAPPGAEDQVLKLKEKYGEDSPIPFQIAWHQHNQGKACMACS